MAFYIPTSWLQVIHYYYFCVGIFSFASSVIFSSFPNYAILFIVSYILNSAVCWYMSWWIHKKVKQEIILNYQKYFINHIILAIASVALLVLLLNWNFISHVILFNPETQRELTFNMVIPEFMDIVIGFNYFAFFTAFMWSVALRFDVINKAFDSFNKLELKRAKDYALKSRRNLGIETILPSEKFEDYKPGTNDRIDSLMMTIWKDKKSPNMKILLKRLELTMTESIIEELTNRMQEIGHIKNASESDVFMISNYQKLIDKYSRDSYKYEQKLNGEQAQG